MVRARRAIGCALAWSSAAGCVAAPATSVVLENDYPSSTASPLVVYRAYWQAVAFEEPVAPGASSDAEDTVPASANTAYVILAPGWDPSSDAGPTSFVLLESRDAGFAVSRGDTLTIPVDDTTFVGNCATGNPLPLQEQADFITQRVFTSTIFPDASAPFRYEAATCTTIWTP